MSTILRSFYLSGILVSLNLAELVNHLRVVNEMIGEVIDEIKVLMVHLLIHEVGQLVIILRKSCNPLLKFLKLVPVEQSLGHTCKALFQFTKSEVAVKEPLELKKLWHDHVFHLLVLGLFSQ